jgi:hypothetical protein
VLLAQPVQLVLLARLALLVLLVQLVLQVQSSLTHLKFMFKRVQLVAMEPTQAHSEQYNKV